MSETLPSDPLDNMLQQWADERAASSEYLDNLQDRIVSAIHANSSAVERTVAEPTAFAKSPTKQLAYQRRPVSLRRASLVGRLIGATLLALIAFLWSAQLIDIGVGRLQIADAMQPEFPDYAQLDDGQLDDRMIVLSEMRDVFGNQLNWLAETDSRIEVGLSGDHRLTTEAMLSRNDIVEIAVRVVVEERTSSESEWRRTWSADVISQNEEVVELEAKHDDRAAMTMWAYVLPDGMVAIDSELSFSSDHAGGETTLPGKGETFHAAFSNVQKDRQPSEELLTGEGGVEYRVLHTVAVLNKKVG